MGVETLIERIGAPIAGDNPAGVDSRADGGMFRQVKDAANEARRIEKKAELSGGADVREEDRVDRSQSMPYWRIVSEKGTEVLTKQSKDLEIASFVIEASVRLDGIVGLRESLQATRLLVENFWDNLYPLPDDGDGVVPTLADRVAARVDPLERLSGNSGSGLLVDPINWLELTEDKAGGPFCLWQYKQSLVLEKLEPKERELRVSRGMVTKSQFDAALRDSSTEFCRQLVQNAEGCLADYKSLIEAVTNKYVANGFNKSQVPSLSSLTQALEAYLSVIRTITAGRLPTTPASGPAKPSTEPKSGPVETAAESHNALATREDAFRALNDIADFFEGLEPQSLLPHQLRKLVRQSRLKPADYFLELIEDPKISAQLLKSCGLDSKATTKSGNEK